MRSKNQASAFYCYGLVNVKKLFHKLLPIKIIIHNLKMRNDMPQKIAYLSLQKIMVCP